MIRKVYFSLNLLFSKRLGNTKLLVINSSKGDALVDNRYAQEPEKVAAMILLGNALAIVFVPVALALTL